MKIVKQRRKKLLVWILTLIFCVGMWKETAKATEGDIVDIEKIEYSDNIEVEGDVKSNTDIKLTDAEFTEDGEMLILKPDIAEFNITAITNNYEHKLISWVLSGGVDNPDLSEAGSGNTIKRNKDNGWSSYNFLSVNWGKIIELKDEDENTLGVCYEESVKEDAPNITIKLPENWMECQEGYFFSGWDGDIASGSINENIFTARFGDITGIYQEEILRKNFNSTIIPGSGSFSLRNDLDYKLGAGSWKVEEDGYTYSGDQTFYLPAEGNYTFISQGSSEER